MRARRRAGHGRQHGRRARPRAAAGRRRPQPRHQRHRLRASSDRADGRPDRHRGRVRRRHRPLPPARLHAQRHQGDRRRRPPARRRHRSRSTTSPSPSRPEPAASCSSPTSTVSAPRTAPMPPGCSAGCAPTSTRGQLARAAVEGVVCNLLDGADALGRERRPSRAGSCSSAAGHAAPPTGRSSPTSAADRWSCPREEELVARGAALQAAAVLAGRTVDVVAAEWGTGPVRTVRPDETVARAEIRIRYSVEVERGGPGGAGRTDRPSSRPSTSRRSPTATAWWAASAQSRCGAGAGPRAPRGRGWSARWRACRSRGAGGCRPWRRSSTRRSSR